MDAEERMEKARRRLPRRAARPAHRPGHARPWSTALRVEYYGSPTPLKQLATISTPDPQQIVIRPFDAERPQGHREGDPLQRPGHGARTTTAR